ncbi:MAG TPA: hypothetical protein VH988_18680 [Thermoanaerobaculia bacterium]|nr:hypothetical protein [Thermoanaerobaculia bacterium]
MRQDRGSQDLDDRPLELVVATWAQRDLAIRREADDNISLLTFFSADLFPGDVELGGKAISFRAFLRRQELGQLAVQTVVGVRIVRAEPVADHPAGVQQGPQGCLAIRLPRVLRDASPEVGADELQDVVDAGAIGQTGVAWEEI